MNFDDLRPLLSGLAGAVLAYLLSLAGNKPALRQGERRMLRFGMAYRVVTVLTVPFAVLMVYWAASSWPEQAIAAILLSAGLVASSAILVTMVFMTRLEYDEQHFHYSSKLFWNSHDPVE